MIALVSLPKLHEIDEDLVGCLASRLEVRVEAGVVGDTDVFKGDLTTAVFVKYSVGLMDHRLASRVKIAANGAQKFIERQLAVLVRIEVLDNLGDFDLAEVQAIVAHGVLELDG